MSDKLARFVATSDGIQDLGAVYDRLGPDAYVEVHRSDNGDLWEMGVEIDSQKHVRAMGASFGEAVAKLRGFATGRP